MSVMWNYIYQCSKSHYWLHQFHIYTDIIFSCAYEVIGICGISVTYEGEISCWHINGHGMVNKSCSLLFWLVCTVMWGPHVEYSISVEGHTCLVVGIFVEGHMQVMWNICISSLWSQCWVQWETLVQEHIPIIWNVCISVFLVMLLIVLCSHEACAYDLIGTCSLYRGFRDMCFWPIHGSNMFLSHNAGSAINDTTEFVMLSWLFRCIIWLWCQCFYLCRHQYHVALMMPIVVSLMLMSLASHDQKIM